MSVRPLIPVISLVGGVGSGKSAVSKELSRRRRLLVIDGDQIGHAVLCEPAVIQQVEAVFGPDVLDSTGAVSRTAVAERVFGDSPGQNKARKSLENIVHPRIRSHIQEIIRATRQSDEFELVILDAALLFEAGWDSVCDLVVFVAVPEEIRLQRVIKNRNWTEAEFRKREASQLGLEEKLARSDCSIQNDSDLAGAVDQLERHLDCFLNNPTA